MNLMQTLQSSKVAFLRSLQLVTAVVLIICTVGVSSTSAQILLRGSATTATTTSTSITISKPAGVAQGDILLVNIAQQGNNTNSASLSGWTLIQGSSLAGTTLRYQSILYKIATSSEPSSYTFTLGASTNSAAGGIIAFSGVDTTSPFDVANGTISVGASATSISATAITTATANAAVIMFGAAAASAPIWSGWSTTSPGSLTELFDVQGGTTSTAGAAWGTKTSAGSTGTGTATLSTAERNGSLLIALTKCISPTISSQSTAAQTKCAGVAFSAISVSATGSSLAYQWYSNSANSNSGGTLIPGETNSSYTPPSSSAGTTYYYCKVSNSCGFTTSSVSGAFVVNAAPSAPTAVNASRCGTGAVTISATRNAGDTITWYSASSGGYCLKTNSASYTTTNISATTIYYAADSNKTTGCLSARTAVTATINTVPSAPTAGNASRCGTGAVTITATPTAGNSINWYSASTNGTLLQYNNTSYTTPSISSNNTYYALDSNTTTGCVSATRTAVTATVNSNVTPSVSISSSDGDNVICAGTSVTFTATPTNGGTPGYQWQKNGVDIGGQTSSTYVTTSLANNDSIRVVMTPSGICVSPSTATSSYIKTTVNAAPSAPTAVDASRCGTGAVTISAIRNAGDTITWYSASSGGYCLLTNSASYTTPSISANTIYYAADSNKTTGCLSARTAVTANVNALPSAPTAGNASRCGTGAVTITATPTAGNSINWYSALTNGTLLQYNNTSYTTPSISSNNTYYALDSNTTTGCVSASRTAVTATINAVPSAPTAGNASRCGTGAVTITATRNAGDTITWYSASSGGYCLLSNNASYTTPSISANTIYYAADSNKTTGCLSARTAVTATINTVPSAPTAGNASRCGTGSVTITATPTAGNSINWYSASTNGTLLQYNNTSYTTPSISSNNTYYALDSNTTTGCVSASRTAVTATINTVPSAPTAGNASRCGTGAVTITATPTAGNSINWYSASTNGTLLQYNNTSYTTPSISSNNTYYALDSNTTTGCVSASRTAVTATINAVPGSVTASANITTFCGSGTIDLTGSATGESSQTLALQNFETLGSSVAYSATVASGTGSTITNTNGSSDGPASSPYFVSSNTGYRINNGSVTITTDNIPNLGSYSAKKVSFRLAAFSIANNTNGMENADSVELSISLDGGTTYKKQVTVNGGGSSYWSYSGGTGVASVTYNTSGIRTLFSAGGAGNRTTDGYSTLEVTIPDTSSQVRIKINMLNNSANETWAIDDIKLVGTAMSYTWESSPVGFTSSLEDPKSVSVTQTTTYTLTATNSLGCTATDTALVTVNPLPSAPTGTAGARCGTGTVNLSATPTAGNTISWYTTSGGTYCLRANSTSFTTPSITTNTTYYAVDSNTTTRCVSSTRTAVLATVNANPSAPTAGNNSRCSTGVVTITATPTVGNSINWYSASTNGTLLQFNNTSYTTPSITATTQYYALDSNTTTGCVSTRTTVTATVNPNLAASVSISSNAASNAACIGTNVTFTATPTNGGTPTYQWQLNGGNVGTNSATYSNNALVNGDIVKVLMSSTATCATGSPATSNEITMTINPLPSAPTGTAGARCGTGTVNLSATPTAGNTISWYTTSGGTYCLRANSTSFTTPSITTNTTYYAVDSNTTTRCVSSTRTAVLATVNANPSAPTAGNNSRCSTGVVTITATPTVGNSINWYSASTNGTLLQFNNTSYTTPSITATTQYYALDSNTTTGCVSTRTTVTATVNPNLAASVSISSNAASNAACIGTNVTFTATPTNGGTPTYQWQLNGGNVGTNSATYSNNALVNGDIVKVLMSSTATCATGSPATSNEITMTINPLPSAPTGTAGARCGTGTVNLSATPTAGNTISWYTTSGGTYCLRANSTSFTTPSITTNTTYYAVDSNTTTRCVSSTRTAVLATVNANPSAPTANDSSRCGAGVVTITATPTAGNSINWYSASTNGTLLQFNNTSYTTPSITATTQFYAVDSNTTTGCVSTARTAVNAKINPLPSGVVASSNINAFCGTSGTVNLTGSVAVPLDTIAIQNFESVGSTVSYAATVASGTGGTITNSTGSGDGPASSPYYVSSNTGYRINGGSVTITTGNIPSLNTYTDKKVSFRLASFSIGSTGNGADAPDSVELSISLDGGTTYKKQVTVNGGGNSYWSYSGGTGVATATYNKSGIRTLFSAGGGGNRTTDGYSTMEVSIPDTSNQVRIKITMLNSSASETWAIDDIKLVGKSTINYSWASSPAGFTSSAQNPTSVSVTDTTIFTLTATDRLGCANTDTAIVYINPLPISGITNNTGSTVLNCSRTAISVTATGGTSYTWDNSLGSSATASITAPGTYTVTVTGGGGCTSTASITVTQDIVAPSAGITNNTNSTVLTCIRTSISVTATGGTSYAWSGGLGTSADASISAPGTYTVTVTGANGCTSTSSITVTQDIVAPTAGITNNTNSTVLTCVRTAISVTGTGGVSYAWSDGLGTSAAASITAPGTYTVTVTGANGCTSTSSITVTQDIVAPTAGITNNTNETILTCTTPAISVTGTGGVSYAWDNSLGTSAAASITAPGTYTVTVTGANGCTSTASITTTQDIATPTAGIINNSNETVLTCNTTNINVTATGGPSYAWSDGLGTSAAASITAPGTYTITVTGANGCTSTASITVTQDIVAPIAGITNNTNSTVLTCVRTAISVTATGGVSYAWSGGLGSSDAASISAPGTYTVTVTGANGCTSTASITVTQDIVAPTAGITNNTNETVLTCNTTNINVTATGGPSYAWSGGLGTSADASISSPGAYTITVTGANGCTSTASITVTQDINVPANISNNTGTTVITCATTSISVLATGGVIYSWDNSLGSTAAASITDPGTYTVNVTGANGCSATVSITVTKDISTSTGDTTAVACDSFTWYGTTYNTSANPTHTFANSLGCDSVVTLHLTVNQSVTSTETISSPIPVMWHGALYSTSNNTATWLGTTVNGCDSTVTLDLTITCATTYGDTTAVACESFTWHDVTYTASATPTYTYINAGGCDSIVTLNLTINNATSSDTTASACGSFTWKGSTYQNTGNYYAFYTNVNGCDSLVTLHLTINSIPSTPGAISGPIEVCSMIGVSTPTIYSIADVPGASSYIWTVPTGATIVSGQGTTSIGVTFDNTLAQTNQRIKVSSVSSSSCSNGLTSSVVIYKSIPLTPTISGPSNVCRYIGLSTNAIYTCDSTSYAAYYTWTVPTGATLISGQGTRTIEVNFSSTYNTGSIGVTAVANCGSRTPRVFSLSRPSSATPASITGPTSACSYLGTGQQVTYTIAAAANATSYLWTVPAGVSIVSGQNTTSLVVTFSSTFTTNLIKVKSLNNCSSSSDRTLSVVASAPAMPASLTGPTNGCYYVNNDALATYTCRKSVNATSYSWTLPAGIVLVSHPAGTGANDTVINVTFNSNFVYGSQIIVRAVGCGTSAAKSITITGTVATMPGSITGPTNACEFMESSTRLNGNIATYTIRKISNASSYNWTAPANATIVGHPAGLGVNDTSVQIKYSAAFTGGTVTVSSSNACGTSAIKMLSVYKINVSNPGIFDEVMTSPCPNRVYTYTLASMPSNSTSVIWTVPSPGVITNGQGTAGITVSYPSAAVAGFVTAQSVNNCSAGTVRSLRIKYVPCPSSLISTTAPVSKTIEMSEVAGLDINVFPNPTTTNFNVKVISAGQDPLSGKLMDAQGRVIKTFKLNAFETISIGAELKSGSYIIEVHQGNKVTTKRIVKF